jgi:hypothetical protein
VLIGAPVGGFDDAVASGLERVTGAEVAPDRRLSNDVVANTQITVAGVHLEELEIAQDCFRLPVYVQPSMNLKELPLTMTLAGACCWGFMNSLRPC